MLKSVRHATKSGLSYVMVAGLIVVFAFFFGVPADSCGSNPNSSVHMATVAGKSVATKDLNVIYNQLYGSSTTTNEAEVTQQRALSLKAYLLIELLAHQAREAGLRVDGDEFKSYMLDPLTNGEFLSSYGSRGGYDAEYYRNYVENFLLVSREKYERFKHDELLARKYVNMAEMQIGVLPQELTQLEELRNTSIDLEFARFSAESVADAAAVSEEEVAAYIEENQEAIQKEYEEREEEYSQKAEMEIRRIYLEKDSTDDAEGSAEERFAQAKERLDNGEEFADIAGEINDALKGQQGLMAMSPVENMDQNIVDALEGAEVGDVREVDTDSALMLVQLVDKVDASKTPLSEVEQDIARELLEEQKVNTLTQAMAEQLHAKAKELGSLSAALEALQDEDAEAAEDSPVPADAWALVSVESTGDFTLEGEDMSSMFGGQLPPGMALGRSPWDNIPKIGQSRSLTVDAFKKFSQDDPVAEKIYTVEDAKFVVSLKNKTTADAAAKSEDADEQTSEEDAKLTEELIAQKTQSLMGQWQRLFNRRTQFGPSLTMDYGPWLEQQYQDAIDSGLIKLNTRSGGEAVAMIDPANVTINADEMPVDLESMGLGE